MGTEAHLVLEVVGLDAILGGGSLELLTVVVLADAADVRGGRGLGQPLRDADGVLGSAAGNVLHLVVGHDVLQRAGWRSATVSDTAPSRERGG